MHLMSPLANGTRIVEVIRTDEKGSDVNLATWLLFDGCRNRHDTAAVISNDSDLVEPIRIVIGELGLPVRLYNPQPGYTSSELNKTASFCKHISEKAYRACQFPDTLCDAKGTFRKPPEWQSRLLSDYSHSFGIPYPRLMPLPSVSSFCDQVIGSESITV